MRPIVPLFATAALFATGCVMDIDPDDGHHYWNEPVDATAEFTWEFFPSLSCRSAEVSTVTVVIDDLRYRVDEFTESCYAPSLIVEGLAPGTYHVEVFGDPTGWWAGGDVTLYAGYNDVHFELR